MKIAALIGIVLFIAVLYSFKTPQEVSSLPVGPPEGVLPTMINRKILDLSQIEQFNEHPQLKPSDRWILVNFWAQWCWPCQQELPDLNQWAKTAGPFEFDILLVNSDPEKSEAFINAEKYLLTNTIDLPHSFDFNQKLKQLFQATELPAHFLLSPDRKTLLQFKPQAVHWSHPETISILRQLIAAN